MLNLSTRITVMLEVSCNFPSFPYTYIPVLAFSMCTLSTRIFPSPIDIGLNTFRNVCDIYLKTWNNATLNFHDNKVENSSCLDSDNCLLHAFAEHTHHMEIKDCQKCCEKCWNTLNPVELSLVLLWWTGTGCSKINHQNLRHHCLIEALQHTYYWSTLNFHDNKVENSSCLDSDNCLLHAFAKGNKQIQNRMFSVSTNVFTNINSKCVVKLQSSSDDAGFDGLFNTKKHIPFLWTYTSYGDKGLSKMLWEMLKYIESSRVVPSVALVDRNWL
jgi:hypothetical protein